MTVKEMLHQLREMDYEIEILEKERAAAWYQATRATTSPSESGIHHEADPHRFDNLVILDDEICRKISALTAAKALAIEQIYSLNDPRYRKILIAYYVDCRTAYGRRKTWEMVAEELSLSWRQLMYAKQDAMKAIEALEAADG